MISALMFIGRLIALAGTGFCVSRVYSWTSGQVRYGKKLGLGWFDRIREPISGEVERSTAEEAVIWVVWTLALAIASLLLTPSPHWWHIAPVVIGALIGFATYG